MFAAGWCGAFAFCAALDGAPIGATLCVLLATLNLTFATMEDRADASAG